LNVINRESAWCLLTEFTQSESLRKHALAVEACMRACAGKYGQSGPSSASSAKGEETRKGHEFTREDPERREFTREDREGHEFTRANVPDSYQGTASVVPQAQGSSDRSLHAVSYQGTPSGVPNIGDQNTAALAAEGLSAEDLWAIVGLIHDFDYEKYPSLEDHPYKGNEVLKERGWPEVIRRAIMSHAEYTGVTRDTPMEKALFACDELAGFITAVALIKPGKWGAEVDVKSVRKRMKDKAFARKVNRDDIVNGAADLGVDLDEHIGFCIEALRPIAKELGLDGSAAKTA
jgi:predicted hydrolase (HD superfamily)